MGVQSLPKAEGAGGVWRNGRKLEFGEGSKLTAVGPNHWSKQLTEKQKDTLK